MKISLTDKILIELKTLFEENHDLSLHPARYFYKKGGGYYERKKEGLIRATIDRLRRNGYIAREEKDGRYLYWITEKGKRKIYRYIFSEEEWDKKWRIVIFDIPEKKKIAREIFRDKLKELGFLQLQKSVWVAPYDLLEELNLLREEYELGNYVIFLEGRFLKGEEEKLKEKFFAQKQE